MQFYSFVTLNYCNIGSDMKMENIQKSGITIVTLVITVIILTVLTGAVMLTTNNSDIFGQTQTTID